MVANMRASNKAITDFNVGSVARVLLEAPAAEIDELYQSYAAGLVQGIPTALYQGFAFDLLPPAPASGLVTLSGTTTNFPVPLGFAVSTATGQQYQAVAAVTVPAGGSVDVLVVCTVAGEAGNCAAGAITTGAGLLVTNPLAFANGTGAETDDQRKTRFIAYVKTLARGTVAAVIYAARLARITDPVTGKLTESVTRVTVDESPGYVALYYWNGVGNVSPALAALVQGNIDGVVEANGTQDPGYRPTGMKVAAEPMTELPVPVSISIQVPPLLQTDDTKAALAAALAPVILAVPSGGYLLPLAVQDTALRVPGVTGAEIVSPLVVVPCPPSCVLVPGAVTVSWL